MSGRSLPKNAELQRRLLLALNQGSATSIADLARRVGSFRPSTLRAVRALESLDLVNRDSDGLRLSEAGIEQARELLLNVPDKVVKSTKEAARAIGRQERLRGALESGIRDQMMAATAPMAVLNDLPRMLESEAKTAMLGQAKLAQKMMRDSAAHAGYALQSLKSSAEANRRFRDQMMAATAPLAALNDLQRMMESEAKTAMLGQAKLAQQMMRDSAAHASFSQRFLNSTAEVNHRFRDQMIAGTAPMAAVKDFQRMLEAEAKTAMLGQAKLAKHIALMPTPKITIDRLIDLELRGLEFLREEHDRTWLARRQAVAEANSAIARTIADASSIAQTQFVLNTEPLARSTFGAIGALTDYQLQITRRVRQTSLSRKEQSYIPTDIVAPPTSTSMLVGSARGMLEAIAPDAPILRRYDSVHNEYDGGEARSALTDLLRPYGARFVRKWEGAWVELNSDSPDRYSATAGSARELINQLLDYLAPRDVFSAEAIARYGFNGNPTRRMKIRWILTGSGAKASMWVERIAAMIDDMQDLFVSEHHSRLEVPNFREVDLAFMLAGISPMLQFLIVRHQKRINQNHLH